MVDKLKRYISVILAAIVLAGNFVMLSVSGEVIYPVRAEISSKSGAQIWSLPGTKGHEVADKKNQSEQITTLDYGTAVTALGEEKDGDGETWYKISYGDNNENTGYAFSGRVKLYIEYEYDEDFETNLSNFPSSYHAALRELHAQYPNWRFVANDIDLTFKEAVEAQYGVSNFKNTRKWVEFSYGGNEWRDIRGYNSDTDEWETLEMRWTYASPPAPPPGNRGPPPQTGATFAEGRRATHGTSS